MKVYVVTGLELGWDCVVGVYSMDKVSLAELSEHYPSSDFVITVMPVEIEILT